MNKRIVTTKYGRCVERDLSNGSVERTYLEPAKLATRASFGQKRSTRSAVAKPRPRWYLA
jgi:hypothetical protein